jgi:hypothetical protein
VIRVCFRPSFLAPNLVNVCIHFSVEPLRRSPRLNRSRGHCFKLLQKLRQWAAKE